MLRHLDRPLLGASMIVYNIGVPVANETRRLISIFVSLHVVSNHVWKFAPSGS